VKNSSKVGIALALGLTMSSSFVVWEKDAKTGWSFGLRAAQASVGGAVSSKSDISNRAIAMRETARLAKKKNALIARVRHQLLNPVRHSATKIQ
jgi:hypothetical protein